MPYNPETGEWISDADLYNLMYTRQYDPTGGPGGQGSWSTVPTGEGLDFQTDFDPDLSAQEIANMSGEDLDQLLKMYDLDPDKYSKYFAKFDQSQIDDIKKNFETKLGALNIQSKQALGKLGEQERAVTAQRGFEAGEDLTQAFKSQKEDVFSKRKLGQDEALMGRRGDIRSAYEDYESKFQSALGGVEAQIDAEDADSGGSSCCFIVLEVENNNELDRNVRQYRDEQLNDLNRAGYYKLAQVVVPLMRKSKLMKWFFKYSFVKPAKSWAKWYYNKKGMGWIFEPLRRFWLGMFTYLGKEHKLRTEI